MTSNLNIPSAMVKVLLRSVAVTLTLLLTSCSVWRDTEVFERPGAVTWEKVDYDSQYFEKFALYDVKPADAVRAGLSRLVNVGLGEKQSSLVVLGPGDQIHLHEGQKLQHLLRRADIQLQQVGGAGRVEVSPELYARRCEVVAFQVVTLAEHSAVERVRKSPTHYVSTSSGRTFTADQHSVSEGVMLLLPIFYLHVIYNFLAPDRAFRPTRFKEEVIGSYFKRSDDDRQHTYLRPAAGKSCAWEFALAGPDGPVKLTGTVTTTAEGRAIIPIWQHANTIRENLNFSTTARLTVGLSNAAAAIPSKALTINILQLDLGTPVFTFDELLQIISTTSLEHR